MKPVVNPETSAALAELDTALDRLFEAGVTPKDNRDATTLIGRVERVGNRVAALKTQLMAELDETMLYANDGHSSAKVMVRHTAKISAPEAAARTGEAKALKHLPTLRLAYESGQVGRCQVRRLARAYANKRVREALVRDEARFVQLAKVASYKEFDLAVSDWVRLVDEDGTADTAEANHQNRDARIAQEYNGGFGLTGRFGSIQGAQVEDILQHFVEAEVMADFDEARQRLGPDVTITKDMLRRTDAQRRADALMAALAAGASNPAGGGKTSFVTNIVIDQESFEREVAKASGARVPEADPWRPNFQSRTIDGRLIHTAEATAAALVCRFRRVVMDAAGVTIDLSRQRCFTGSSRLAVQLMNCECGFAGCEVPMSACEIDHLEQWAEAADGSGGGRTYPGNGAGVCARHNRFKYLHGYTTYRDGEGRWHTLRPDGTEVE